MTKRNFHLAVLLSAVVGLSVPPAVAQMNPVPFLNQPLVPDAVAPGGNGFTLTVNGTGFVSGATLNWNGSPRTTTFVSGSKLQASIPAGDIAAAETASVTAANPGPGGGTSNQLSLLVTSATSVAAFTGSSVTVASETRGVVAADFNGDGMQDLAVVGGGSGNGTLSILLGNGDGTFQPPVGYPIGDEPNAVIAADFNNDGVLDVAFINIGSGTVGIALGNGDGTFEPYVPYTAGLQPNCLTAGDFNGDGNLDLAVTNLQGGTISILLGNGDGTFRAATNYAVNEPFSIVTGDFNGDGHLDLATSTLRSEVAVFLGNGDGTFQTAVMYPAGLNAEGLVSADFNGDGKLDLAVANEGGNTVSIYLGNGDGTFRSRVSYGVGTAPVSVVTGDFNGNGTLDLALSDDLSNVVSVLLGNGDGTFQKQISFATGVLPLGIATADFNGDGKLDLVTANVFAGNVSVLLQAPNPVAAVSPASLIFAAQVVGTTSATQSATLTNTGEATLTISAVTIAGTNAADFLQSNNCGTSVAPLASCTIHVSFQPHAPNTRTASLSITDNAAGSPQTVSLTGTGTTASISPTTINFGDQPLGTTSPPQTATLRNAGMASLTISRISIGGSNGADFKQTNTCPASLVSKASCSISVTFTPNAKGSRSGTLLFYDSGGGSPQKVTLSGTGT